MRKNFYLLCGTLCILLMASCSKEEPKTTDLVTNGLVGYWSFDGNFLDGSGNEIDGINNGGTFTNGIDGSDESALELNGNLQYVQIPNSEKINFEANDDYTVSLWVAVPFNQSDVDSQGNDILSKWQSPSGGDWGYTISMRLINQTSNSGEQSIHFARWDSGSCENWEGVYDGSMTNNDDVYRHYILRYSSGLMEMFVDGELTDSKEDPIVCETENNSPLYIGIRNPEGNIKFAFEGKVDELRIYDRAITDSEIGMLANE